MDCSALGTITARFGEVIRDVSLSNIPIIIQKEIYATITILWWIYIFMLNETGASQMLLKVTGLVAIMY
ncbi:TRIC cation channel family protein [Gelidibacter gilvus]|uniref:TRIC cation channel family protein n=1 Tax=Gelidibacter maritimus TaxID=2761487 RepID=A0A7W2R3I1_9FLAO|nr:TRIC cation channel family protein [Gelidibacter maritimus]